MVVDHLWDAGTREIARGKKSAPTYAADRYAIWSGVNIEMDNPIGFVWAEVIARIVNQNSTAMQNTKHFVFARHAALIERRFIERN